MKEGGKHKLRFALRTFFVIFITLFFVIFSGFYHSLSVRADVPQLLSFQGRLTDSSGNLLGSAGTNYYFKFTIYDALTSGNQLWTSGATAITLKVTQGVFNTLLGDTSAGYSALNLSFDNPSYYLEVQVSSDNASFETLSPRQRIVSSGFAVNSSTVHGGRFLNASGVGQFGGLATVSYSRFGTNVATHGLTTSSDVLINGILETDSQVFFDANASVSSNFEVAGKASVSAFFGAGLNTLTGTTGCTDGTVDKLLYNSTTGKFSCGTDATGASSFTGLAMHAGTATATHITNLTFEPGAFNFSNVASSGTLTLDYINGPASRSIAQTISGNWTFSSGASFSNNLEVTNNLISSSSFQFVNASGSANLELTGASSRLGINSGAVTDTMFEVGGTASISNTLTLAGLLTATNTGSNSFSGSLNISKSLTATNSVTAGSFATSGQINSTGTASNSFSGSLNLSKGLTVNSYQGGGLTICSATGKVLRYGGGQYSCGTLTTSDIDYSAVFQPLDATLTSLAAFNTNGILTQTGADTFTGRTLTGTTNQITISNGDGVSANPTFSIPTTFSVTAASLSSNFEVAGYASVGGNLFLTGNLTDSGTGSSSFTGSLNVTKSITSGGLTASSLTSSGNIILTGSGKGLTFNGGGTNVIQSTGTLQINAFTLGGAVTGNSNNITGLANVGIGTTAPVTRLEVQGTASASYGLFGTLQIGGFSSVSYSRFGISTTTHNNYISANNDLLISGDLETRGTGSFAGPASLSNTMWVSPGSSGNVGIGTSAPGALLDVAGTGRIRIRAGAAQGPSTGVGVEFGMSTDDLGFFISYNRDTSTWEDFSLQSANMRFYNNGTEHVRIDTNGNIGIGETGPEQKLDVAGNIIASASGAVDLTLNNTAATFGKFIIRDMATPAAGRLDIIGGAAGATTLVSIASGGNVGIGTNAPTSLLHLSSAAPVITLTSTNTANYEQILFYDGSTGIGGFQAINSAYSDSTRRMLMEFTTASATSTGIAFRTGIVTAERMRIDMNGNVGIGTTAPTTKFEVQGTASASNIFIEGSLQVGAGATVATVAYNRFGTTAVTGSAGNWITASNDVLVSGDLYGVGSLAFKGPASLSSTLWVSPGSYTGNVGIGTRSPTTTFQVSGSASISTNFEVTGGYASLSNTMLIKQSGNVGIGNTSPDQKLDIAGNIAASTSGNIDLILRSSSATADDGKFIIRSTGASDRLEIMNGTTPTSLVTIASTGNVGVGSTAPTQKLDVQGVITSSGAGSAIQISRRDTSATAFLFFSQTGDLGIYDGLTRFTIQKVTGRVGIGSGAVAAPANLVDIASASDGNILRLADGNGTCLHNPGTSTEAVTCSSDSRMKTNIVDAPLQLPDLMKFQIRNFNNLVDGELRTGVIAQEVQQNFPNMVSVDKTTGMLMVEEPNPWILLKGIQEVNQKTASLSFRIDELEKMVASASASLTVNGTPMLNGGLIVNSIGRAGDTLAILSDAIFFGRPYFNSDTGGFAVIKEGTESVDIVFDQEYLDQPVVSADVSLENSGDYTLPELIFKNDIKYIIANKTTTGFTIMLNKLAPGDIKFSWIALAIKNAKTFDSTSKQPTPTPMPSATPLASDIPTPSSADSGSPAPSPSATPSVEVSVSPTPTISSEASPSVSPEASPSATPSPSETPTPTPLVSETPTPTPTEIPTPTPVPTEIVTPTPEP